jgi:hypothetical protein
MHDDPILEEVRRIKDEHAARYGGDLQKMARELKAEEVKGHRKVVSFEPRRVPTKPKR